MLVGFACAGSCSLGNYYDVNLVAVLDVAGGSRPDTQNLIVRVGGND